MSIFDELRRRIRREMEEMEREIEEMMREARDMLGSERPMWSPDGTLEPLYSVHETPDAYIIRIDLAGGDTKTLTVEARGHTLTITCKLEKNVRFNHWGTLHRHISFHRYKATIHLPPDAEPAEMTYKVQGKIVEIRIPRTRG